MKSDQVGMEGFLKNNAAYSPIYRKSPKRLGDSSLERQNRGSHKEEPSIQVVKSPESTKSPNNENSLFKTFQDASSKWSTARMKLQEPEKDLFCDDLMMDTTLYSPIRMSKRASSKMQY